jgi:hypothetical protein
MNKCLGCHNEIERPYNFCSYTCACLCGYYDVKKGWIKNPSEINQEIQYSFLNNPPVRGNYPDKDKF